VAILGPNGCGKSTLIKTITRECYPAVRESSWMKLLGHESWDVFKLRQHMGIVSNDLMLSCTSEASGRDVVLSGFFSSTAIWPNHTVDPGKIKLADAALDELKILHLADRAVCEMSSGEARRVLIARALVHKPWACCLMSRAILWTCQPNKAYDTPCASGRVGYGDHSGDT
jgi:iron complex transport system ATP-binding protein